MYLNYFALTEPPFSIAVDPRFLFMSARHRDALAHLSYGVGSGGGFILLSGEVGTGKTTVVRSLLEQMPERSDIAIILNPALNTLELLASICDELQIDYRGGAQSLKILSDKLHQFLLQNYARGRKTVLLIDEAQHLQFEVLEQIRLLTNLETNTEKLLQIILVGQPELRTLLNRPELRQLAQRITARYQLKPLNLAETADYIDHRLKIAGLATTARPIFPTAIIKRLHRISRGIPRVINVLCDRMLLGAYGNDLCVVNRAILKQASIEVMGEEEPPQRGYSRLKPELWLAMAALLLAALLTGRYLAETPAPAPQVANTNTMTTPVSAAPVSSEQQQQSQSDPALARQSPVQSLLTATTQSPPTMWSATRSGAQTDLAAVLGQPIDCNKKSDAELRCETMQAKSWQDLIAVNRPAVITLVTTGKMQRYALLLALAGDSAVLYRDGRRQQFTLQQLGQQWSGEFSFIWRPPSGYQGAIAEGERGELVQWLSRQFAKLDRQPQPLAEDQFNAALAQRVTLFQRNSGLRADGVVGLKTLLALNEQLNLAPALLRDTNFPSNAATEH